MSEFPMLLPRWRRDEYRNLLDAGCPESVPWSFVEPHEAQAQRNHGQTLKRLAERGGLSVAEMLAVVEGRSWFDRRQADDEALPGLLAHIAEHKRRSGAGGV